LSDNKEQWAKKHQKQEKLERDVTLAVNDESCKVNLELDF